MNQVWKCGFCTETKEKKLSMEKHEAECFDNPTNKTCLTCKNRDDVMWEGQCNPRCTKGFDLFSDDSCNSWILEVK